MVGVKTLSTEGVSKPWPADQVRTAKPRATKTIVNN